MKQWVEPGKRAGYWRTPGGKGGRPPTHGHTRGGKYTREFRTWKRMMERCYLPSDPRYKNWGGRGITVCDRWHTFQNFLDDMGLKPEKMTLERIDNDKGYLPDNCKWATYSEQNFNRRRN